MRRLILDTNTLISGALISSGAPALAIRKAAEEGVLLASEATMAELISVLARPKFDRYILRETREAFLVEYTTIVEDVPILHTVQQCRDPKDDKFLELALNGRADYLITGDQDLLVLDAFHGTKIITAQAFNNLPSNY